MLFSRCSSRDSFFIMSTRARESDPSGKALRAAAMRNQELQRQGVAPRQTAFETLHERMVSAFGSLCAGGVEAGVATGAPT